MIVCWLIVSIKNGKANKAALCKKTNSKKKPQETALMHAMPGQKQKHKMNGRRDRQDNNGGTKNEVKREGGYTH